MFYRIVALALVGAGLVNILNGLTFPLLITHEVLEDSAIGLSTIFLGLLNLAYAYNAPKSIVPKVVLLAANLIYMGFAILLITSDIDVIYGYTSLVLSLFNCVMVLNHKV